MALGIEFILKANTASFTKGLAAVENATKGLQKSLMGKFEGRDLARGLATAFGLSVDKIADKFARLWTGMSEQAEEAYKRAGELSDELTRKTIEYGTAKLTTEQQYQLALDQTAKAERDLANIRGNSQDAINQRMEKTLELLDKQKLAEELLVKSNNEKIDASNEAVKAEYEKMDAEKKTAEKANKDAREELRLAEESDREFKDSIKEKFAPTVEQLASMETGGFTKGDDPRLQARKIMEIEQRASILGSRGDITGALKLGTEAATMRAGLSESTGGGTALTAETAKDAFAAGLEATNKKLDELDTSLKGIIKAQ
jgi:hypothetical protein